MAEYLIQSETLDDIVDAINAKTGGSSAMTPAQMVTAIGTISGGGGGSYKLLASGQYTLATQSPDMYIPVSYSGTPCFAFVVNNNPDSNVQQALSWAIPCVPAMVKNILSGYFTGQDLSVGKQLQTGGTQTYALAFTPTEVTENQIHVRRIGSSSFDPHVGTYDWYIWGV